MEPSPLRIVPDDPNVLPALRALFSNFACSRDWDADQLADVLGTHVAAIEAAREALIIDGEELP
jgi:hypothetical protein